jgi:ATP/maltotriose-dependent transcriptional regulator MalT
LKRRASPADPSRLLERARRAHASREYARAFDAFTEADEAAGAPLAGADFDLWAMCALLLGRDADALRVLERAHHAHLEAGATVAAVRSAFWLGFRLISAGEKGRGGGWLARARRLVDECGEECVERGYLLLPEARLRMETGDNESARTLAADAERIGERYREPDLIAVARSLQGHALIRDERVEEGLRLFDEAMVAAAGGELTPVTTGFTYCSVIYGCQLVYALDRAREWTDALKAWCAEQPDAIGFNGYCRLHRSEILQLEGAWADAEEEARRASERLATGLNERDAAPALYQRAELHRLRGEHDRAEAAYRDASRWGWDPQPGLALLRLSQGRVADASAAMRRALAASRGRIARTRLLPAHVEVAIAAGDLEEARRAAGELAEIAEAFGADVLDAMAAHAAGAVALAAGDAGGALPHLRRSFETWQRLGAPYLAARVRVAVANACRALRDDDGCGLELDAARSVFASLGAGPDVARVDALARGGAAAAAPPRSFGLTARELQVLRLVAAGKTNRTIATELFLSEKTVDRHVSNIFDKLDVSSRAAATAFAYENRLV